MKILISRFLVCIAFMLFTSSCYASSCDVETIQGVTSDGTVITLSGGTVWKVDPGDSGMGWSAGEEVLLCGDGYMINKNENDRISITQLQ